MTPSVTEIISSVNSRAFDHVPEALLMKAANRGTLAHSEFAMSLLGLWFEPEEEVAGYLESLTNWRLNMVSEIVAVEPELVSAKYNFKGHPDAIVRLRGDEDLSLGDWKTPKPLSKSWRLQLAGYRLLCLEAGYNIKRIFSLRLDIDGGPAKFQGYTKTLAADQNTFLAALNVWKFFNLK